MINSYFPAKQPPILHSRQSSEVENRIERDCTSMKSFCGLKLSLVDSGQESPRIGEAPFLDIKVQYLPTSYVKTRKVLRFYFVSYKRETFS